MNHGSATGLTLILITFSRHMIIAGGCCRLMQNSLLSLLGAVGISNSKSNTDMLKRGALVRAVLKRLTMADASNFYNLASLESSVFTLLRLTSR